MKSRVLGKAGRLGCAVVLSLGVLLTMGRSGTRAALADAHEAARNDLAVAPLATATIYLPFVGCYYDGRIPPFGAQYYRPPTGSRLAFATDAGMRWIRIPIYWGSVEPTNTTPDNYDWSRMDPWITATSQEGVHFILTLQGQPSWAAIYPQGPVTNTADLVEFVGALVERYDGDGVDDAPGSPVVQHLEVYNEQDNADVGHAVHGGWGYWGHNGAGYAELLRTLYPVVKAANANAKLVFGGVSLDDLEPWGPIAPEFLDETLAACEGYDCFDLMNFHYYPCNRLRWEQFGLGPGVIGKANYVRQKLAEYGFSDDIPLICTETSWPTSTDWGSDELQSRYVCKGYVRAMAAGLDIVIWYEIDDRGDPILPGLLDSDLQPKPSYTAYQTMAGLLTGAQYQQVVTFTVASTTTTASSGQPLIYDYVFERAGRRLDVVWTEVGPPSDPFDYEPDDDPSLPLTVTVATLRVVDKGGVETWLNDEDDGAADGCITVTVGGSPLYLEYYP